MVETKEALAKIQPPIRQRRTQAIRPPMRLLTLAVPQRMVAYYFRAIRGPWVILPCTSYHVTCDAASEGGRGLKRPTIHGAAGRWEQLTTPKKRLLDRSRGSNREEERAAP